MTRHSLRGPVKVLQVRNIPEATWDQPGPKDQIKDRKENRVRALSSQEPRGTATGQDSPETIGHTALQTPLEYVAHAGFGGNNFAVV